MMVSALYIDYSSMNCWSVVSDRLVLEGRGAGLQNRGSLPDSASLLFCLGRMQAVTFFTLLHVKELI